MPASYERKGPDALQKLFLYLILFDWIILIYLIVEIKRMSFQHGAITSIVVAMFNLLLVKLCFRRARRAEDGYQIYPVIIGALLSFCLIAYFFFF
ncbi:conserved hypothetical protein [Shewanella halifaxensis HAW-EB4]|uniref:Uncharacterized protein n=1 Tax=Shewanella halifaxensis (strain HAW-EB4) TaxID=458817 RepID=B0TPK9_SHEHH|nr:conserved hypothetical protein [Shewanella halifaxensis HAW-EB4]